MKLQRIMSKKDMQEDCTYLVLFKPSDCYPDVAYWEMRAWEDGELWHIRHELNSPILEFEDVRAVYKLPENHSEVHDEANQSIAF